MIEYILYAHVHTGFTIKMPLGDMVAANRIYRPPIKSINIYPKAKSLHVRFISIEKYLVTTQSLYICIKNTSKLLQYFIGFLSTYSCNMLRYQSLLYLKLSKDIYYLLQMYGKEMKTVKRYNANKKNHSGDDDIQKKRINCNWNLEFYNN